MNLFNELIQKTRLTGMNHISATTARCHLWRGRDCVFGAQRRSAFEQRTGKLGDKEPSFEVSVRIQLVVIDSICI